MKCGVEEPTRLVDVRRLPLDGVHDAPDGGQVIGATTTNSHMAAHPEVRRRFPALAQVVLASLIFDDVRDVCSPADASPGHPAPTRVTAAARGRKRGFVCSGCGPGLGERGSGRCGWTWATPCHPR
ncbi:FAD binding domain-containing protein [Micromonospora antibiotica]|uniref:FAD binding domain-containing protein n=1 Tax=Micromonospora antibiotica TaxID=2807623 RepID=UPI001FCA1821|nr:FAD binding domain-containing protein [Micromonospora antibiotica]